MPLFSKVDRKDEKPAGRPIIEKLSSKQLNRPFSSVIASSTEALILIENGQIKDVYKEEKLNTLDVKKSLLSSIGQGPDITVIKVDLRPFRIEMSFGNNAPPINGEPTIFTAPDASGTLVSAAIYIRVAFDDERTDLALWLSGTKSSFTQEQIQERLTPQIFAAVQPTIATHEVKELRSKKGLKSLEYEIREKLKDESDTYGLIVEEVSIILGLTESKDNLDGETVTTPTFAKSSLPKTSEKRVVPALLLCILLGIFGAHRFYVGKPLTAILMILTLGGFGIWVLIDLIVIANGGFKDSNGLKIKAGNIFSRLFVTISVVLMLIALIISFSEDQPQEVQPTSSDNIESSSQKITPVPEEGSIETDKSVDNKSSEPTPDTNVQQNEIKTSSDTVQANDSEETKSSEPSPDTNVKQNEIKTSSDTVQANDSKETQKQTSSVTESFPTGYIEIADLTSWTIEQREGESYFRTGYATGGYVVAIFSDINEENYVIKRFTTDGDLLETVVTDHKFEVIYQSYGSEITCGYSENIYFCSDGSVLSSTGRLLEKHDIYGFPHVSPFGKVLYRENVNTSGCPTSDGRKLPNSVFVILCDVGGDAVYFPGELDNQKNEIVYYLKVGYNQIQIQTKSLSAEGIVSAPSYGFAPSFTIPVADWPHAGSIEGAFYEESLRVDGASYNGKQLLVSVQPLRAGAQSLFKIDLDIDKLFEYTNLGVKMLPIDVPINHQTWLDNWLGSNNRLTSTAGVTFGHDSNRIVKFDLSNIPEEHSEVFIDYSKPCKRIWASDQENTFLCQETFTDISLMDINGSILKKTTMPGNIRWVGRDLNVWWSNHNNFGISNQNGDTLYEFEHIDNSSELKWGLIQSDGTIVINPVSSISIPESEDRLIQYVQEIGTWFSLANPTGPQGGGFIPPKGYSLTNLREQFICPDGVVYWDGGNHRFYESIQDLSIGKEFNMGYATSEGANDHGSNMKFLQCVARNVLIRGPDGNGNNFLTYYTTEIVPKWGTYRLIHLIELPGEILSYTGSDIGDVLIVEQQGTKTSLLKLNR